MPFFFFLEAAVFWSLSLVDTNVFVSPSAVCVYASGQQLHLRSLHTIYEVPRGTHTQKQNKTAQGKRCQDSVFPPARGTHYTAAWCARSPAPRVLSFLAPCLVLSRTQSTSAPRSEIKEEEREAGHSTHTYTRRSSAPGETKKREANAGEDSLGTGNKWTPKSHTRKERKWRQRERRTGNAKKCVPMNVDVMKKRTK